MPVSTKNTKPAPATNDFELATAGLAHGSQEISLSYPKISRNHISGPVVAWLAEVKICPVSDSLCKRLYALPKTA